jgi:putative transcriptional regulator
VPFLRLTATAHAAENRRVLPSSIRSAATLALACVLAVSVPLRQPRAQGLGDSLHRRTVKELAAGKLLVASRHLPDPNFANTVVLLADFNSDGAMGLIVNRPTPVTLARLFPEVERTIASAATAFMGGPVSGALALVRASDAPADARRIVGDVHLVNSRAALEKLIAAGAQPNRFRVYLGYAGWGPGQLEVETAKGVWRVLDGDADIVFDANPEALWQRQILRTEALSAWRVPTLKPAA